LARKKYKVKRYYGKNVGFYRAKPHPLVVILVIAVLAGLGFLGTVIYEPVYDFIMNIGRQDISAVSEPVEPEEPEDNTVLEPEDEPAASLHENMKAVYIPHEIVSGQGSLDEFLSGLDGTEINAVMIDVKNDDGEILYTSKNEAAAEFQAVAPTAVDLQALSSRLGRDGYLLVARMSVFRDPLAAGRGHRAYAIGYRGAPSALWLDNAADAGGRPWLNPYSMHAQDYIDFLADEITSQGVGMLVLENLRFPDNSATYAVFNEEETDPSQSRAEILRDTLARITEICRRNDARIAVFYTALEPVLSEGEQNRYGGPVLQVATGTLLLDVRPALFGADYPQSGLEITDPLQNPAEAVAAALTYVKSGALPDTQIIPYLQGGNAERFNAEHLYGKEQVDAQIKAAGDLGFDEYFLFSADGEYFLK